MKASYFELIEIVTYDTKVIHEDKANAMHLNQPGIFQSFYISNAQMMTDLGYLIGADVESSKNASKKSAICMVWSPKKTTITVQSGCWFNQ